MKNHFSKFLFLMIAASGTILADIDTNEILEKKGIQGAPQTLVIPMSDSELDKWKLAFYARSPEEALILEWIPKNEEISSWSELLQVQYFPFSASAPQSASSFAHRFLDLLKEQFPSITSKIDNDDERTVILEWSLPEAVKEEPAQSEVAKIIDTKSGIYRVAFTKKQPTIDKSVKQAWQDRLQKTSAEEAELQEKE